MYALYLVVISLFWYSQHRRVTELYGNKYSCCNYKPFNLTIDISFDVGYFLFVFNSYSKINYIHPPIIIMHSKSIVTFEFANDSIIVAHCVKSEIHVELNATRRLLKFHEMKRACRHHVSILLTLWFSVWRDSAYPHCLQPIYAFNTDHAYIACTERTTNKLIKSGLFFIITDIHNTRRASLLSIACVIKLPLCYMYIHYMYYRV